MMFSKEIRAIATSLTLIILMISETQAASIDGVSRLSPKHNSVVREGNNALAPFAFIRFCVENPADCRPGDKRVASWDKATQILVKRTNLRINRRIHSRRDRQETWNVDVRSGDCEDFALTKRRELIRSGIPHSALRMAVAKTASGEGHAILVLKTNAGDYVLDNRTSRILPWRETDLIWEKISSARDPRLWRRIY